MAGLGMRGHVGVVGGRRAIAVLPGLLLFSVYRLDHPSGSERLHTNIIGYAVEVFDGVDDGS